MSPPNDHVHRLRALIARGMANPQDELNLRLLLLSLYGRPGRMVELDNPDRQGEEDGEGERTTFQPEQAVSLPEDADEETGQSQD